MITGVLDHILTFNICFSSHRIRFTSSSNRCVAGNCYGVSLTWCKIIQFQSHNPINVLSHIMAILYPGHSVTCYDTIEFRWFVPRHIQTCCWWWSQVYIYRSSRNWNHRKFCQSVHNKLTQSNLINHELGVILISFLKTCSGQTNHIWSYKYKIYMGSPW